MSQVDIRQVLERVHETLEGAGLHYGHGSDNAWDESVFLVFSALGLPLDSTEAVLDQAVTMEQQARIHEWVLQRVGQRMPLPYITGEAWFCGLPFTVNRDVLIPRSPIAELIEYGFEPWLETEPAHILDLCTGSGCIGISCALAFPHAQVHLADISPAALAVARQNIERHEVARRVQCFRSDLFDGLPDVRYDLIVTNPPYVDAQDMAALPSEFHHEPALGLEAGADGLDLVRRILRDAPRYLSDEGLLVCEVGNSQPALEAAFPQMPFVWVEFEYGGQGVFVLSAAQLKAAARS